jgi:heme O synthase-like polyprenyltransferase
MLGMAVSGAFFLYYGVKLVQSSSRSSASHLLHASVVYLPVVLAVMMVFKR